MTQFTPAQDLAFLRAVKALTPIQAVTIIVWVLIASRADRVAIIQRVAGA